MTGDASPAVWRATGLAWSTGAAALEWSTPGDGAPKTSPLDLGAALAFTTGADRRCTGLRRAGRRHACPTAAPLPPASRSAQCPACQTTDRADSIAADTRLHDPRPFAVYLAHHGSTVKVGITAVERGQARLLEQGALASTVISTGSLLAARRVENLLGQALGLPDRVSTSRKRAARAHPGTAAERATALLATAESVKSLSWPEGQTRTDPQIADHTTTYGLPADGLRPDAAILPPTPGSVIAGRITCRIGADLYLHTPAGLVLLDTRLLAGWSLTRAEPDSPLTAHLEALTAPEAPHSPSNQACLF
ncbi:DUF2797 domain-containing protein [Kitasatospora sp. NBC_01302]|uniref:DUF2797 domain-containing protein n=1 Tax=Kitasatospora sp. NBC_01302 TaxID=2903575 RepID=UPI002E0EA10D|nr:DUF2797 domain-containing protein [Kitasatospora sp. NBC_01302]